jgi:hypothetical protein
MHCSCPQGCKQNQDDARVWEQRDPEGSKAERSLKERCNQNLKDGRVGNTYQGPGEKGFSGGVGVVSEQ